MDKNLVKWIDKNVKGYEVNKTVERKPILFIPYDYKEVVLKHLKRIKANFKYDSCCNCEWIEIIFEGSL